MSFLDTAVLMLKIFGATLALLLILLSLPSSKLRDFLLPPMAWSFSLLCGLLIASPVDFVPDFIPVLGWVDDAGLAIAGITSALAAIRHTRS
jgi:hypothetical protein